jgi:uncharacterized membrane protein
LTDIHDRSLDDDGQIAILIVTFLAVAALMAWVAIDASIVFLARQRLASAADGAALTAAQQLNAGQYYGGECVESLPLDQAAVEGVLERYRTGGITLEATTEQVAGGPGVAVAGELVVDLPTVASIGVDSWTVRYDARARSDITGVACP